jgi:hypothetical protein
MSQTTPTLNPAYNPIENELEVAQNFMNSDTPLTPKMISSLMHVGVSLHSTHLHEVEKKQDTSLTLLYSLVVITVSIALAAAVGTTFLYVNEIGPFYTAAHTD